MFLLKKIIGAFVLSCTLLFLRAEEGMWLPNMLSETVYEDMVRLGLKLSKEEIYDINKPSLKDAIVLFGRGCTGSLISAEGLLITNHHCGYSQIQQHSSIDKDYLTHGFWAKTKEEELPNPGLTATIVVRIENVTSRILEKIEKNDNESIRNSKVDKEISKIINEYTKGTHYTATVKAFNYGNEYYLFVFETFKDIRLVGAPPSGIGNFGGDTDNWTWPRHTGDFALFRIYADKNNLPAPYSKDNVPYKPKKYLTISLKGVNENDFTMVYGFPGITEKYLPSHAVKMILESENPAKIMCREIRLKHMKKEMENDNLVRIKYASKYASVANYHKKWIGENMGLKRFNVIQKKLDTEKAFTEWVNQTDERKKEYGNLLKSFENLHKELEPLNLIVNYYYEAILGIEIIKFASKFIYLENTLKNKKITQSEFEDIKNKALSSAESFYKDYSILIDKKIFSELIKLYHNKIDIANQPIELIKYINKFKGDFSKLSDYIFEKSVFSSKEKFILCFSNISKLKNILKDPVFILALSFEKNMNEKIIKYTVINDSINILMRKYVKGLQEFYGNKTLSPDANSTLRISYGKISSCKPKDAVIYNYYTTAQGILEKENPEIYDYTIPKKLKELIQSKNYSPYAYPDGSLRTCFIATNHTTGGNSGSPVLNAYGELIGINFDRMWEGTMSDIYYNSDICRNITVDIKYVLFVIDKVVEASYLLNEMKIAS